MNTAAWKKLLTQISKGYVVPVIGNRLLVDKDGASLQRKIAEKLLAYYSLPVDPPLALFHELNDAVSRLRLKTGTNLEDLYIDIDGVIGELTASDADIPVPIQQLAEIKDFRLFVTLTPDDMLARCLRQYYEVNEIVHSPKLPACEARDLPADWQSRSGQVQLLYLFGKSEPAPVYAIHDEDLLEYAHNVITRGKLVPKGFLNELQDRNLLLIGCNFPDWLSRFFLRVTSQNRLSEISNRKYLIIDELEPGESLACFLRCFCRDTEILSQIPPVAFVADLYQHWQDDQPVLPPRPGEAVPRGAMFFISYSRCTDLPRAERLYQALLAHGVKESEVWFDRKSIEPGNVFRRRILDGIWSCSYFIPLLSVSANTRKEAFVFGEWREANERKQYMKCEFIIPVVVDADFDPMRYTADDIVQEWKQLDFGHAPDGVPDARTTEKLRALVREARRGKEN